MNDDSGSLEEEETSRPKRQHRGWEGGQWVEDPSKCVAVVMGAWEAGWYPLNEEEGQPTEAPLADRPGVLALAGRLPFLDTPSMVKNPRTPTLLGPSPSILLTQHLGYRGGLGLEEFPGLVIQDFGKTVTHGWAESLCLLCSTSSPSQGHMFPNPMGPVGEMRAQANRHGSSKGRESNSLETGTT